MKIDRQAVYNKYRDSQGCHCAYCGKVLPSISDMQVDHIIPKARGWKVTNVNDYENCNPSCRSCNGYKRNHSPEGFRRKYLGMLHDRLARQFTVRVALDYNIITLKPWDRKFYFEKVGR
jgi:5-methylcytosine-specific restriction endonuclease McrA